MQRDDRTDGRTIPIFESQADRRRAVEAGEVSLEHAAFVVIGVLLTVAVFFRGIGLL